MDSPQAIWAASYVMGCFLPGCLSLLVLHPSLDLHGLLGSALALVRSKTDTIELETRQYVVWKRTLYGVCLVADASPVHRTFGPLLGPGPSEYIRDNTRYGKRHRRHQWDRLIFALLRPLTLSWRIVSLPAL
jgi:hypothetical protein